MDAQTSQETIAGPQAPPRFGLAALIVANALLALGPLLVRLSDVGPVAAGFWRLAIAFPVLTVIALATGGGRSRLTPSLIAIVALSGVIFAADLGSWHLGIVRTKMANATLFGNSASLLFPIYGFIAARAWPTRMQGFALALAAAGAILLMGRSAELSPENVVGDLLSLLAGVFYAIYFIAIAKARATLAPMPLLAASTLAGAIPMLFIAIGLHEQVMPSDWTPLIILAVGSQIIGQGLMVYALGRMSPLVIGLALLIQPVVATTIGWLHYGEGLGALDFAGAAMVGLALVLVRQPAK